jgi:hypothetical protein
MKQTDIQRLEDKFDHAISLASQKMPDSISPIMFEMRNKINSLTKAIDEIREKQELHMAAHTITDKNTSDSLTELQETLKATLEQSKKTNGRVTRLEEWKTATSNYAKGLIHGGKSTWVGIATTIGIGWVLFGEVVKRKLGL